MPITISQQDYCNLVREARSQQNSNHNDKFNVTHQYPEQLGKGTYRNIQLRQGVELAINNYRLHDDVIVQQSERSHPLEYVFVVTGKEITGKSMPSSVAGGQYKLFGSGMAPTVKFETSAAEPIMRVNVHIKPEVFQTFLGNCDLADMGLEHLIRPSDRCFYRNYGITTVAMQTVLHQILHCPFQGITKKVYLESKVWELMSFLIGEEKERHESKDSVLTIKPDDIERIHHAKEILTQQIDNPPPLFDLALQVGLNDYCLKRGFREVFGTTAFGYLHDLRLEQARQLLLERCLNVTEIALKVGFANRTSLSRAFRRKYGVSPKQYQKISSKL